ncbi:MAG: SDR family NAD(P)-dependent oxidoreductase, partial [Rhizobiales bacterium]|nr:SDR family NAD(P)-dependent oxidoreductase [Hyphomicrobiales bacterium]
MRRLERFTSPKIQGRLRCQTWLYIIKREGCAGARQGLGGTSVQVTYDFSGKSALLIGGTTGIGRATALAFAKAGANLFVAGIGAQHGASLKDEVKSAGKVEYEFLEVDVRDVDAMAKLHQKAFDRFGRIDFAFNNAGVPGKT